MLNLLLRSQFIRGLSDADITEKLLQQGNITFVKNIEIALSIEVEKLKIKKFTRVILPLLSAKYPAIILIKINTAI